MEISPTETRMIAVVGDAEARGRAQGDALGSRISQHFEALLSALHKAGIEDQRNYLGRMVDETRFEEAIDRHVPHLMTEVHGIAGGAGLNFRDVYALQLLDEEWAYRSNNYYAPPLEKCSSFAIRDPGSAGTWIGQNMDLGTYTDGHQCVVEHRPQRGPSMLLFTTAGMIGLLGVNEAGVGVRVNSLPQLPNSREGIPVAFMIRRLLEATSAEEAGELCRSLPHATNQHYLIADPGRIISLECSAAGVTEYLPSDPTRVLHTNHPLANWSVDEARERNSVARLRSLQSRLSGAIPTDLEMQQALSAFDDPDHPVCRVADETGSVIGFTTGAMISLLSTQADRSVSYVSFGPPSERGFERFALATAAGAALDP